jgi:hypothetical protein
MIESLLRFNGSKVVAASCGSELFFVAALRACESSSNSGLDSNPDSLSNKKSANPCGIVGLVYGGERGIRTLV